LTSKKDEKKEIIPVFIPSLISILYNAEKEKGSYLTEDEVYILRDKSAAIMMEVSDAHALAEKRGYKDINPENAWKQWVEIRDEIHK